MIRVGINGFGRIGRAIFKIISNQNNILVTHINDINPSIENLAYLLKYDSIYGQFYSEEIKVNENLLKFKDNLIKVTNLKDIDQVDWDNSEVDMVIDSSGVVSNYELAKNLLSTKIKKVIITHSTNIADKTIIFGVNEQKYNSKSDNVISSSICDANAIAPVLNLINEFNNIKSGSVTTLHPWLGYQNLSDGPCRSFAYSGEIYSNFSLGRASTETLIPKTTSCVNATLDVLPELEGKLISMSYRVPTPVVSSAILHLNLKSKTSLYEIDLMIKKRIEKQKNNIFSINYEPLTSKDFVKNNHSLIVDQRWTEIDNNNNLRIMLWYDNEWGYSSRVVDLISYL